MPQQRQTHATCLCGRVMDGRFGCDFTHLLVAGPDGTSRRQYKRIRYGQEDLDWGAGSGKLCHDCNTPPEAVHHWGCDVERCPACGMQLIGCDCDIQELVQYRT